tara:strand:- start:80 stop:337 length:258 start_codon:yes stop_codon:yes gene_type:complete
MSLATELEASLMKEAGPLLTGDILASSLGYPSRQAFRKAVERKAVPVPIFEIPRRRGKYALARDVARWLASLREQPNEEEGESMT